MPSTRGLEAVAEIAAKAAALCVAASALCYAAEVVARYVLSAPLNFSGDVSSYLLCACIFLALPKVTGDGAHVAITFVAEWLPGRRRAAYMRALQFVTGVVCLLVAGFVAWVGYDLYRSGVLTSQATQIPKWIVAALAVFGFGGAALQLLLRREILQRGEGT